MALPAPEVADTSPTGAVVELLTRVAAAAGRHDRADLVGRLAREQAGVTEPTCRVLVVGEFKKGKSSLVNALLNARVCIPDADLATAVPTVVRYGPQLSAVTMTEADADAGTPVPVPVVESLAVETLAVRTTGAAEAGSGGGGAGSGGAGELAAADRARVRSLDVSVPRQLLRDGMVLVDTPGVGGGLASAHAAATLRALAGADAVLFVSDAGAEYTAPELEFLRQAADLCPNVVCALTKIDFYPEWRRILDLDRGHLARAGLEYAIVPLSAPLRHHGVRTADRELIAESGYPRLADLLRRAAATSLGSTLAGAAAAANAAAAQLVSLVSTEHEALRDPAGQDDRRARWSQARRQAEELKSAGSRWQQVLADRISDFSSNVDLDLGVRLRAVRRDASQRVTAEDPTRSWPELEPWLHTRTNEALLDHVRVIRDQADEVADAVAAQFGAAAWELRIAVEVPGPGDAARDVGLAAVAADRASRVELGLVAVRGGSTGAVLTHTVGLVLGLALPVTLPATAVLATFLARRTWRSARSAQLRVVRAEAERTIMAYLDEVELVARKDSRDAVRQVHRQLREVFAQRATELYASTAQNLERLGRTLQQDERSRKERLAETGAELARLRELATDAGALLDRLLAPPPRHRKRLESAG